MSLCHILTEKFWKDRIIILHFDHNARKWSHWDIQVIQTHFPNHTIISEKAIIPWANETQFRKQRLSFYKNNTPQWSVICTGHTLSHRIETTLMNTYKWSSFSWLYGIREKSHLISRLFFRPLLWVTKNEILEFCHSFSIPYCIDQTNFDITYTLRNKIRDKIKKYDNIDQNFTPFYTFFDTLIDKTLYNNIWICNNPWQITIYSVRVDSHFCLQVVHHILHISWASKDFNEQLYSIIQHKKQTTLFYKWRNYCIHHWIVYMLKWPHMFWQKKKYLLSVREACVFFGIKWNWLWKIRFFTPWITCFWSSTKIKKMFNSYKIPVFYRNILPIFWNKKDYKEFLHTLSKSRQFR